MVKRRILEMKGRIAIPNWSQKGEAWAHISYNS